MKTKALLIFATLSISSFAQADCLCKAQNKAGNPFVNMKVANIEECKSEILSEMYEKFKTANACVIEKTADIKWSCGDDKAALEDKQIQCDMFRDLVSVESGVKSINFFDETVTPQTFTAAPESNCEQCKTDEDFRLGDLPGPKIGVRFHSDAELRDHLEELKRLGLPINVSEIFDKLKNASYTYNQANDNNYLRFGTKGSGTDRGYTHGISLNFTKNIGDGGYTMTIDYQTNLFTSYTNPVKPNYTHEKGVTHVDQYFIEENLSRIVIAKAKKGDAFYWSAGGGIHELNKDDANGDSVFSGVVQQRNFHEAFIKYQQRDNPNKRVTTKLYNNIAQDGSESALFVEGEVGKRQTIGPSSRNFRVFADGSTGFRLTGIKDASYAQSQISLNADLRITGNLATRATTGQRARIYTTGQVTSEKFVEVTMGNRAIQQGFRVVEQKGGRLPAYQNPLPSDFADRDYFAPQTTKTYQFFFKVLW